MKCTNKVKEIWMSDDAGCIEDLVPGLYKIVGAMTSFKYAEHFWRDFVEPEAVPVGIDRSNSFLGVPWFFLESISMSLLDTLRNK